jgi:hypothetical protein
MLCEGSSTMPLETCRIYLRNAASRLRDDPVAWRRRWRLQIVPGFDVYITSPSILHIVAVALGRERFGKIIIIIITIIAINAVPSLCE